MSNDSVEIVKTTASDVSGVTQKQKTAYEMMLQASLDPNCDTTKMQTILNMLAQVKAAEANSAYASALVRFQTECPIIEKKDKAYDKMYARIDRIWRTIRPLMKECGLAITWVGFKEQNGVCLLDGHITHCAGHSVAIHHEVPLPDQIKGMNATQRSGAAETYAKRYAMCSALGIQTGDDDDGHGGAAGTISEDDVTKIKMLLKQANRTEEWLCSLAVVKSIEMIRIANLDMVMKLITSVIEKAKAVNNEAR